MLKGKNAMRHNKWMSLEQTSQDHTTLYRTFLNYNTIIQNVTNHVFCEVYFTRTYHTVYNISKLQYNNLKRNESLFLRSMFNIE